MKPITGITTVVGLESGSGWLAEVSAFILCSALKILSHWGSAVVFRPIVAVLV